MQIGGTLPANPILFQCWSTVFEAGRTLEQHTVNATCFLGRMMFWSRVISRLMSSHLSRDPVRHQCMGKSHKAGDEGCPHWVVTLNERSTPPPSLHDLSG